MEKGLAVSVPELWVSGEEGREGGREEGKKGGGEGEELGSPPVTPQPQGGEGGGRGGRGGGIGSLLERALTPVSAFRLSLAASTEAAEGGKEGEVEGGAEGKEEDGEGYPLFLEQGMLPRVSEHGHPEAFGGGGGGGKGGGGGEGAMVGSPGFAVEERREEGREGGREGCEGEVVASRGATMQGGGWEREEREGGEGRAEGRGDEGGDDFVGSLCEGLDEPFPDLNGRKGKVMGWEDWGQGREDGVEEEEGRGRRRKGGRRGGGREGGREGGASGSASQAWVGAVLVAAASVVGGMMLLRKTG
jgi:hypothetical protein